MYKRLAAAVIWRSWATTKRPVIVLNSRIPLPQLSNYLISNIIKWYFLFVPKCQKPVTLVICTNT